MGLRPFWRGATVALCGIVSIVGCRRGEMAPPPDALGRQSARSPRPVVADVPPPQWREELAAAYRLRPDGRFLLAFGEVDRLARGGLGPPGAPAEAAFEGGVWKLRVGGQPAGTLTELPDFSDYFDLLVERARQVPPEAGGSSAREADVPFLMPGLRKTLDAVDAEWGRAPALANGARAFARLTFQLPDRNDVSPLLAARALALLAAWRSREPRSGLPEEVLLAHAMGYTRHAEKVAAALPPGEALRLFEARDDEGLRAAANAPGSPELTRFLALVRATAGGDIGEWKQARARYFPDDVSASVIATALALDLPRQVEVDGTHWNVSQAVPRAVIRELGRPGFVPVWVESIEDFDQSLSGALKEAAGPIWDGAAFRAYFEGAFCSAVRLDNWSAWPRSAAGGRLADLFDETSEGRPSERGVEQPPAFGGPLLIESTVLDLSHPGGDERASKELRRLFARVDARPASRAPLARMAADYLPDPLLAERLHRGVVEAVGDADARSVAASALYLGDRETVRRLLRSPAARVPEVSQILWSWYVSRVDWPELDREFAFHVERFPKEWDVANNYVTLLRDEKKYADACAVGERWLARNRDPKAPGQFHAHIRLAHSEALAGQYAKGLALLEGMTEEAMFQRAIIDRGIAECLMGQGKLPEAQIRLDRARAAAPGEPEIIRDSVILLWRQGRPDEAARALARSVGVLDAWNLNKSLTVDFVECFADHPDARRVAAIDALLAEPALRRYVWWLPGGFAEANRPDLAFQAASQIGDRGQLPMESLIAAYDYLKAAKGREAATQWLENRLPPKERNPISLKAFYTGNDDLLWDLISKPEAGEHPEWVWLARAYAVALRPESNAGHRAEVFAYYERDDPDHYHQLGRYALGLITDADAYALATDVRRRPEIATALGIRADGEGRIRDACEWYRVSVESPWPSGARTIAMTRLRSWAGTRQGVWRIEREAESRHLPAMSGSGPTSKIAR